jgi:hypothetical protein
VIQTVGGVQGRDPVPRRVLTSPLRGKGVPRRLRWVLVAALVLAPGPARGDTPRATVLILLPGQPSGTQVSVDAFGAGARSVLRAALPPGSAVYTEYTDLARLGGAEQHGKLRDWYAAKYAAQRPDVIIAGGYEPRAFLLRFRAALWPEVPTIFSAMDARSLSGLSLPPGTTALTLQYDEEGTIRAALALVPDTRRVALVSGASPIDRYLRGLWLSGHGPVADRAELIDLAGLPFEELRARLAALPERTVGLFSSFFTDGHGRAFVSAEVAAELAPVANQPMFSIHRELLGLGVVGGSMTDYRVIGREAAQLALRVLGGAPLPPPGPTAGANRLAFDWRQLQRWRLDESRVPAGSLVLNRPPSAWDLYRWQIMAGSARASWQTSRDLWSICRWERSTDRSRPVWPGSANSSGSTR